MDTSDGHCSLSPALDGLYCCVVAMSLPLAPFVSWMDPGVGSSIQVSGTADGPCYLPLCVQASGDCVYRGHCLLWGPLSFGCPALEPASAVTWQCLAVTLKEIYREGALTNSGKTVQWRYSAKRWYCWAGPSLICSSHLCGVGNRNA